MARKPSKPQKSDKSSDDNKSPEKSGKKKHPHGNNDGWRETVESIVVAFILAFLFRTFEAEAFVIPTGSMAPTLYGRHKDITCEQCGHHFAVGASDELDKDTGGIALPQNDLPPQELRKLTREQREEPHRLIGAVTCPNCRYVTPKDKVRALPGFKGDRILVNKYPFEFGDPSRFDVVVFKFPEEPQTNYIKRLVGLPGESIDIHQGDVFAKPRSEKVYRILRKDDPSKQLALQNIVYDNDHPAKALLEAGWPERWSAMKRRADNLEKWTSDEEGWQQDERKFTLSALESGKRRWLRYRHLLPDRDQWRAALNGDRVNGAKPSLIADFYGYNAYRGFNNHYDSGTYWVGDLTLSFEVEVQDVGDEPELVAELNEGDRFYRCRFNLNDGTCTILRSDDLPQLTDPKRYSHPISLGTAETRLKGAGKYRIAFANVDDRLTVWVNGKIIEFTMKDDSKANGVYKRLGGDGAYQQPTIADLVPAGIGGRGCELTVSSLVLKRDIYYRAEQFNPNNMERPFHEHHGSASELQNLLTDPAAWWKSFAPEDRDINEIMRRRRELAGQTPREELGYGGPAIFPALDDGEYFMMGDNSPRSLDSRLWPNTRKAKHRHAVPRRLLVGKAFFIYWPHGVPFLNDGNGFAVRYHRFSDGRKSDIPSFRVPFYPNIWRMHRIR